MEYHSSTRKEILLMDESWGHYAKWNKTPHLDVEPKKAELIEIE